MTAKSFVAYVPNLKGRENHNEWAFAGEKFLVLEGKMDSMKRERFGH